MTMRMLQQQQQQQKPQKQLRLGSLLLLLLTVSLGGAGQGGGGVLASSSSSSCIRSLDDLATQMEQQQPRPKKGQSKDDSSNYDHVYTLCPHTTFTVGFPDEMGKCCSNGQQAIYPRSHTLIQCGEDGSSANECIVHEGRYQLLAIEPNYNESSIEHFAIQGVTFQGSHASLLLAQTGEIVFEDCIVKNHQNKGAVHLLWEPASDLENRRRRGLNAPISSSSSNNNNKNKYHGDLRWRVAEEYLSYLEGNRLLSNGVSSSAELATHAQRQQQQLQQEEEAGLRLAVSFINCLFEGNSQGDASDLTRNGIISIDSAFGDLAVEGCTFRNNTFNTAPNGYAIWAREGSSITVQDSCFRNNQFTGNGPVEVFGNVSLSLSNNFVEDNGSSDVECDFVAQMTMDGGDLVECMTSDATTCSAA